MQIFVHPESLRVVSSNQNLERVLTSPPETDDGRAQIGYGVLASRVSVQDYLRMSILTR